MSDNAKIGELYTKIQAEKAALKRYEKQRDDALRKLRDAANSRDRWQPWSELSYPSACEVNRIFRAIRFTADVIEKVQAELDTLSAR